jgi:hypothetical protein
VAEAVRYKQPRKFNWVVVVILAALVAGVYVAWLYIPVAMRKSEVMRVLDETSSEFTGKASRMLADKKFVAQMLRDMTGEIQALGVSDPEAEYWIEVDSDDQVRFGVLYSDWIQLPWGEPREKVVEVQMFCTRPGRGSGWSCEGQDLQSSEYLSDQPVDPQSP